jgi:hypothetical protein
MRRMMFLLVCLSCGLPAGCGTLGSVKPRHGGYRDDVNSGDEYHDEWSSVRSEGRATDPTEHEWDSWTPHLMTSKAMAIEKNLGYGY